jgi:hypothetical protein
VSTPLPITEADILSAVIAPNQAGMDVGAARAILALNFNPDANSRIRHLLDLNNRDSLTDAERAELDKYLRVGQFLDLMHAKARVSLAGSTAA